MEFIELFERQGFYFMSNDGVITNIYLTRGKDVEAKHKVFALLGEWVAAANGHLQVIVLDNADEDVWGGLDHVVLAGQWRDHTLVPLDWFSGSAAVPVVDDSHYMSKPS